MTTSGILPLLQHNEVIDLTSATLAASPYDAWKRMSGVAVTSTGVQASYINRQLVGSTGDDDTPPSDPPVIASAVNNDVGMVFTGDFQITATLLVAVDQDVHLLLYGVVPMLQDEWQSDNNMIDIEIEVWDTSANTSTNTATAYVSSSDKNSAGGSWEKDFHARGTLAVPFTVVFKRVGTTYSVTAGGKLVGSWTVGASVDIFPNGEVYFGFYANGAGQTGYLTSLTAQAVGAGSTVRRRDMGAPFAPAALGSLRAQAALNYPDTRIGTCVAVHPLAMDREYAARLGRDFSQATPENCMKFQLIEPQQGMYEFGEADLFMEFAERNGMRVHGHNLVWFNGNPVWLTGGTFTAAQVQTIMENHIAALVGRYAGRIAAWDVINEPFKGFTSGHHTSVWSTAMGTNYINLALHAAHTADPAALMFINEWGCEAPGTKQDALYGLCQDLLAAGVPLHGVGFQMHEDMNDPSFPPGWPQDTGSVSPDQLRATLQRFKGLGLQVRVSEMDVNLHVVYSTTVQKQGDYFRDMMAVCIEEGARDFTMWGFTDRWSSNQGWEEYYQYGNSLIFDTSYVPKIAYTEMLARLGVPPA